MTRQRHQQRHRQHSGFTLIELVASAVLTAMMMAGLMSVVWSAVRDSNELKRSQRNQFPTTLLADRMRADFQNARGMSVVSGGVVLHGFLGANATPGRVAYQITQSKNRSVMLRADGSSTELAWVGAMGLSIEPLEVIEQDDQSSPIAETGGLPAIPGSFRVTLYGSDQTILFREVVHHHDA